MSKWGETTLDAICSKLRGSFLIYVKLNSSFPLSHIHYLCLHLEVSISSAEYMSPSLPSFFLGNFSPIQTTHSSAEDDRFAISHIHQRIFNSLSTHKPASLIEYAFRSHHPLLSLRCYQEARSRHPRRRFGEETSDRLLAPWRKYSPSKHILL